MSLEKEANEISDFEKRGNEDKYLSVLAILISAGVLSCLACKLFKGFSEYLAPYLDTNSYLPFQ